MWYRQPHKTQHLNKAHGLHFCCDATLVMSHDLSLRHLATFRVSYPTVCDVGLVTSQHITLTAATSNYSPRRQPNQGAALCRRNRSGSRGLDGGGRSGGQSCGGGCCGAGRRHVPWSYCPTAAATCGPGSPGHSPGSWRSRHQRQVVNVQVTGKQSEVQGEQQH